MYKFNKRSLYVLKKDDIWNFVFTFLYYSVFGNIQNLTVLIGH